MREELSLLEHCQKCGGKCCIAGETIGTPIISKEEMLKIKEFTGREQLKEVVSPTGCSYWVVEPVGEERRCPFLTEDYKCSIQLVKPADCLCFPFKAVWLTWRRPSSLRQILVDRHCPAFPDLSVSFISSAVKVAEDSLKRFDRITYLHWLLNYVGWVCDYERGTVWQIRGSRGGILHALI